MRDVASSEAPGVSGGGVLWSLLCQTDVLNLPEGKR